MNTSYCHKSQRIERVECNFLVFLNWRYKVTSPTSTEKKFEICKRKICTLNKKATSSHKRVGFETSGQVHLPRKQHFINREWPQHATKTWTANDNLSVIWKSHLTDKIKQFFFQAAVVSILLYGCTTWTLTKRMEKKFDGNYTRMLQAVFNKPWRKHHTKQQLYGHPSPIMKTIQIRRTRHAGHN